MEHRGFLLVADITGYTRFLNDSELEHANQTLAELLGLLVDRTQPPFAVSQLEGDAVMSYAFHEPFVSTQTFLEGIEETYVEFRRAIDLMVLNNTCQCNACANVSSLDLKFIVHHGAFVAQPVGETTQLVGPDVNLLHRLLKNNVTADTGIRAYLLVTEPASEALALDPDEGGLIARNEAADDFGSVPVLVKDMSPAYEKSKRDDPDLYAPEDIIMIDTVELPMPLHHAWSYLNDSPFRNLITGSGSYEVLDRTKGRVAEGSTYRCYHGNMVVSQLVLLWQPFRRVAVRQLIPIPGRKKTHTILDFHLESDGRSTKLSRTVTQPVGPLLQRKLARLMLERQRSKVPSDIGEFARVVADDYSSAHRDPLQGLMPRSPTSLKRPRE